MNQKTHRIFIMLMLAMMLLTVTAIAANKTVYSTTHTVTLSGYNYSAIAGCSVKDGIGVNAYTSVGRDDGTYMAAGTFGIWPTLYRGTAVVKTLNEYNTRSAPLMDGSLGVYDEQHGTYHVQGQVRVYTGGSYHGFLTYATSNLTY